jgi:hypothetical protein
MHQEASEPGGCYTGTQQWIAGESNGKLHTQEKEGLLSRPKMV